MLFKNFNKLNNQYLNKQSKIQLFKKAINSLTLHHYKKSKDYKKIIDFLEFKLTNIKLDKIPFLPAKIFKELYKHELTDKGLKSFLDDWEKTGQKILPENN